MRTENGFLNPFQKFNDLYKKCLKIKQGNPWDIRKYSLVFRSWQRRIPISKKNDAIEEIGGNPHDAAAFFRN